VSDQYTRITVPLSREEFSALQASAQQEYRHPRDQARFLLRSILLRDDSINNNTVALIDQIERDRVVS
jgi:hypothetical protein